MIATGAPTPSRRELPDPRLRLAQATYRLSWVALVCSLLPWSIPEHSGAVLPADAVGPGWARAFFVLATFFAALQYVAVRGRLPHHCMLLYTVAAAATGAIALLVSLSVLTSSKSGYFAGPGAWVCTALYAGVVSLALLTVWAVRSEHRDERCKSGEISRARARLDASMRG